jgi:hypothetical protein
VNYWSQPLRDSLVQSRSTVNYWSQPLRDSLVQSRSTDCTSIHTYTRAFGHTSSASDPPAPRKKPPSNAPKFCTPFWGPFLDILPPLLVAAINLALSLWGMEGQKRCLWGACKCAPTGIVKNHNQQNLKTTNRPNAP